MEKKSHELKIPAQLSVAAVLLGAGEATRLGGLCKARVSFNNTTLLEHAVLNLFAAGVSHVVCCLRDDQTQYFVSSVSLKCFLASQRLAVLIPRRGYGLSETVKEAYAYCFGTKSRFAVYPPGSIFSAGCMEAPAGILFHQVDRPFIGARYFEHLIGVFRYRRCAVISSFASEWMPPVIVPQGLDERVVKLKNDEGLKKLFLESGFEFVVNDASREELFAFDIDTAADLRRLKILEESLCQENNQFDKGLGSSPLLF